MAEHRISRRSLLLAGAPLVMRGRAAAGRPNIVLLVADDLGSGDLSSYGCPDIRTPNIDAIGRQGVRFTRFYSNAPECTPARTALFTGRYQQRAGGLECAIGVGDVGRYDDAIWLQKRGELGLPASERTMPQLLKERGYDTGCFGKWHLGYPEKFWPARHGFDESFGILGGNADYFTHKEQDGRQVLYHNTRIVERKGYLTDLFADEAIRWLKQRSQNPFFLYVPFTTPHTPIQDPEGYDPKQGTAPWRNGDRSIYAKMVQRMDARIGDILAQIQTMGAAGNTIVLFLSDNGADPNGRNAPLRGLKSTLWEGGIRAPLLIRWPGVLAEGSQTGQVALTMDLLPTLLAAAGIPAAGNRFDGVELSPVLTGKRQPFPRTLFWRYKRGDVVRKAVRDGDLKLVIDPGAEELHDLSTDETERKNLLSGRAPQAAKLREKLAAWEKDVMAPRLRPFRMTPG
jgi:N-acetylgalactosamine-6-sulfatase